MGSKSSQNEGDETKGDTRGNKERLIYVDQALFFFAFLALQLV